MPHLGLFQQVEQLLAHRRGAQRRDGERRDEAFRRRRQHDLNLRAALAQATYQLQRLEGRDPSADDQKNPRAAKIDFGHIP